MFSGFRTIDNSILNEFNLIQRELENSFNKNSKQQNHRDRVDNTYAPVNVVSTDKYLEVLLLVSNLKPDAIDITVDKNVLNIQAEREAVVIEGARPVLKERVDGKVFRQVVLPDNSDSENIIADYKLGVLTIRMAKQEKAQPIKVQVH